MNIRKNKFILPFLFLLLLFACNSSGVDNQVPEITSFNVPSLNTEGAIYKNTITVTVPKNFDFSTKITPEIKVSNGGYTTPASGVAQDFSTNPVTYIAYNNYGEKSVYNVVLRTAVIQAPIGDVYISEVFKGEKSGTSTGDQLNNSYIELYNCTDSDFDLSQFSLKHIGTNNSTYTVALRGTIKANSTFIIHSKDVNSSLYMGLISVNEGNVFSDQEFNGITNFSGKDSIQLLQNGELVDVFNPAKGEENSKNMDLKKFIRKGGEKASTIWDNEDWILYGISGIDSDFDSLGNHSSEIDNEAKKLTYFAFEDGFSKPVVGVIDDLSKTINVTLPYEMDLSSLIPVFGINGNKVTVSSVVQKSTITPQDFSNDVVYTVWANNANTEKYTVSVGIFSYTTKNYNFNGNIKTVLEAMVKGGEDTTSLSSQKDPDYDGAAGTITGVVTAKDVYGSKNATKSFFLQDKDAAIFIFTNDGLPSNIGLGTKITLDVSEGKVFYGMPEITNSGSFEVIDRNNPIYYQTGKYNSDDSIGKVFMYEGTIEESMKNYNIGKFEDQLYFHGSDAFEDILTAGTKGKFYGPITYSREKYRMEISSSYQISE